MSSSRAGGGADLAELFGQARRFVFVGLANTFATGAIFYVLTFVLPAWLAYTVAFAMGILFVVIATPRLVFLVRPRLQRRMAYAFWYIVVYAVGLAMVQTLDGLLRASHAQVVAFTVATTAALGFFGGRSILTRTARGDK
jgi:putative flippase GtrA